MFASVPDMYHVSKVQLNVHSRMRTKLTSAFNRGFKPMQQCSRIVNDNAAMLNRLAAVSYTSPSQSIFSTTCVLPSLLTQTNVHGVAQSSCVKCQMKKHMMPPTTRELRSWKNRTVWKTTRG